MKLKKLKDLIWQYTNIDDRLLSGGCGDDEVEKFAKYLIDILDIDDCDHENTTNQKLWVEVCDDCGEPVNIVE
tara:strand:+ start:17 stop:235 length:219 start_codon:yes stop_codon:yes gene_type:complete